MKKIFVNSLKDVAHLSKSTAWRALKRGYYCENYHVSWVNRLANPAENIDLEIIYKEARQVVNRMRAASYPFPAYMEKADLLQEAVAEVWRISGKPSASLDNPAWRKGVMRYRLMQISRLVRGDRDRFNTKPIEEREA